MKTEPKKKDRRGGDVFVIDPHRIKVNPDNIRDIDPSTEANQRLKGQIIKHGVRRVLLLKENKNFGINGDTQDFICVDGNRRLTMTMEAIREGHPIEALSATIKKKLSEEESLLSMFLDNDAEELNVMAKSRGVCQFVDVYGWSMAEVVDELQLPLQTVTKLYQLKHLPKKVQHHIEKGDIKAHLALELQAKINDDKELIGTIEAAIAKKDSATDEPIAEDKKDLQPPLFDSGAEQLVRKKVKVKKAPPLKKAKVTASNFKEIVGEKNPIKLVENLLNRALGGDYPTGKLHAIPLVHLLPYLRGKVSVEEVEAKLVLVEMTELEEV